MSIQRIDAGPRMTQAVIHGETIYLAGQVAQGATVAEQTKAILAQIDDLLEQAGSDKEHILQAVIWLTDIEADFAAMNAEWDAWVSPGKTPARATGEAKLALPEFKVEIIVTAAKK